MVIKTVLDGVIIISIIFDFDLLDYIIRLGPLAALMNISDYSSFVNR